jgi:hypothetical protein
MARVSTKQREVQQMDDLSAQVSEYLYLKKQIEDLTKQQKEIRDSLMDLVEQDGYEDSDGHMWLDLESPVDGKTAIKRERRTKQEVNEEAAMDVLTERGLYDTCTKEIRVLDEDAIMSALWDEELSETDIDVIYPKKTIWALHIK